MKKPHTLVTYISNSKFKVSNNFLRNKSLTNKLRTLSGDFLYLYSKSYETTLNFFQFFSIIKDGISTFV